MEAINHNVLQAVLNVLLAHGAEYAEIFCEDTLRNTITMSNGEIDGTFSGQDFGASLRIFQQERCFYAYTNDLSEFSLLKLAEKMADTGMRNSLSKQIQLVESRLQNIHAVKFVPSSLSNRIKAKVIREIHQGASQFNPAIRNINITYRDIDQRVTIATSDGTFTDDRRIYTRALANVVAANHSVQELGQYETFGMAGIECLQQYNPAEIGRQAASIAINNLTAQPCPSGTLPVVIAGGVGGTFLHEACGHGLEACAVASGSSYYAGRLGEKIASEKVTAFDSAIIPNFAGSYTLDDEGIPAQQTCLIENGILKGYLVDRFNSKKLGMPPTGNGRKQSYRYLTTSRMSNTYIAPGEDKLEDMIADIDHGLYVTKIGGGNATTATSEFSFGVAEGFLIEKGEITHAVRGGTIIGKASEALLEVDKVAGDLGYGFGSCGASSGNVPVGDGAPSIRIRKLTVSGRTPQP